MPGGETRDARPPEQALFPHPADGGPAPGSRLLASDAGTTDATRASPRIVAENATGAWLVFSQSIENVPVLGASNPIVPSEPVPFA